MIAPLAGYGMRGAIWYQGESNAERRGEWPYRRLFGAMIAGLAATAGVRAIFPSSSCNLRTTSQQLPTGRWAELRESQTETLRLSNTAMAVIIDIGESRDHPSEEQAGRGLRLALAARALTYKQPLEYSGPMFPLWRRPRTERCAFIWTHSDGMQARGRRLDHGF